MPISYFFDMNLYPIEITINNFNWWNQSKRRAGCQTVLFTKALNATLAINSY